MTMETTSEKVGGMETEAIKRKERLKALKRKAESGSQNSESNSEIPKPIFRSYKPQDESIVEHVIEADIDNIETEVQNQLELMKTPIVIDEIDITNLAPRKPDWDLKRDVSKKLEKLERRTQKAIAELIRDRLKQDQENILQVVNVGSALTAEQKTAEDD